MIEFQEQVLKNGLRVIIHPDKHTSIAVLNVLYDVGSRDESPTKTGFAHLFEHLMFGGSTHIPDFEKPLQVVGGENNAFTSTDLTNYYITLPYQNLETALWMESDRMNGLDFNPEILETQRKVVIEEFKQRYLNQPYGDVWHHLRKLTYGVHPYRWPTIGKDIGHIEEASMEDVKSFFYQHYRPNRAVAVVAGNVDPDNALKKVEKWFGGIKSDDSYTRSLPHEPTQIAEKTIEVKAKVPSDAIYMTYHMPGRFDSTYHSADLLSDIIGLGKTSPLYRRLVREKKIFTSISCFVMGSIDPGLMIISGHINEGVYPLEAKNQVHKVISETLDNMNDSDLERVKNQVESTLVFGEMDVLNRAMHLAMTSLSGDTDYANKELEMIQSVNLKDIMKMADSIINPANCSTLFYLREN